ncbi:MAG: M16 family metallopeptidase [Candidatus Limnocylindria bacterium]
MRPTRTRTAKRGAPPHERSVLPNGLRVVSQAMPHARSVSVALFVGVGSRHEAEGEAGLSHMLEHLAFKGTRNYPAPGALSEAVEACGGTVNASTDRELTVYSSRVPRTRADRAFEVVGELVLHPLLRKVDLVAEKPVVVDEIRAYVDSPSDHVFALFDELLFGAHPLGREIAGTPRSVRRTTHGDVVRHWQRWYAPEHMVLAVAGAIDHATVRRTARSWFEGTGPRDGRARVGAEASRSRRKPAGLSAPRAVSPGAVRVAYRRLTQGNLCLGMPGVSRTHADRWALDLLSAVLGDGMSSRLFVELRERRSLAYDIGTFATSYADCGTVGIHAGFDPSQSTAIISAALEQLERVVQDPVPQSELERARAYTRGRIELRLEESSAVAAWLGIGESLLPRILTVEEVVERLEAVTPDDLLRVARTYLRPSLARVVLLGPFRGRRGVEALLAA